MPKFELNLKERTFMDEGALSKATSSYCLRHGGMLLSEAHEQVIKGYAQHLVAKATLADSINVTDLVDAVRTLTKAVQILAEL